MQLTEKEIIALKNLFETDFGAFIEEFLSSFLTCSVPDFHREIYKLILSGRLVLAAPRGFAKSTVCTVFYPIWLAVFGKKKDIIIFSASEGFAVDFLRKIKREIEGNPKIIGFFGDLRSAKWSESHIILSNGVSIRAKGAGSQVRGARPDCIICDDIETDDSVESEDQRRKLKNWLFKACLNTLLPEGQFVIVGTVIHPLSVLSDLLVMDNGWEKRKFQAYTDGIQEEGNEIWTALWTHEKLQVRKREIGSTRFSAEYLNNPLFDESAPIKEESIRYWKTLPEQYSSVIAVDPAYSDDNTADYKVAVLVMCDTSSNRYLAHYIRTRMPLGEFQDAIINLYLQHKPTFTGLGIPNSGVEKSFYASFLNKCQDRKVYPPITELKNVFTNASTSVSARNKKSRIIAALQPLFEQGKYYIGGDHIEARDELLTIGGSKYDDLVDAMAYAEQIIQPYAASAMEIHQSENFEMAPIIQENYGL